MIQPLTLAHTGNESFGVRPVSVSFISLLYHLGFLCIVCLQQRTYIINFLFSSLFFQEHLTDPADPLNASGERRRNPRQTHLQHERMWRVDKDGGILPGGGLQAQLGVRGLGVVGEGDGTGQLAVVQHLLVVLRQVDVALRLELESALVEKEGSL